MIPSLIPSPADHILPVHGSMIMEKCVSLSLKHLLVLPGYQTVPAGRSLPDILRGVTDRRNEVLPRTASLFYTII
jgi:hypothetical protein